jgi:hypothetical protein
MRPYDRKIAIFERGMGPIPDARSVFRLQLAKGADGTRIGLGSAPSGECPLRLIWNRSKHFDEDLIIPNKTDADITAPVWRTNHGMSSTRASVTFNELHSLLSDLLKIFKTLSK